MPYRPTGRRAGRPTREEAEARAEALKSIWTPGRNPDKPLPAGTPMAHETLAGETPTETPKPATTPTHRMFSKQQIAAGTNGLRPREALATAALMQGMSKSEAARVSGLSRSSLDASRPAGRRILSAAGRVLAKAGVTPAKLALRLNESLDAQREDPVDHRIRLDAVKEGFKLHDYYPKEDVAKTPTSGPVVAIQFNMRESPTTPTGVTLLDFRPAPEVYNR